jgi:hypothetical protein
MDIGFYCEGQDSETPKGWTPGGIGVFLHGQAETEAGFDIPDSSVNLFLCKDGEHPVKFNGKTGYTLFLWRHAEVTSLLRGLVCKNSDDWAMNDARDKLNRRVVRL